MIIFDWLFLAIALAGSAAAGWIDLKTTEVPDEVPLFMAVSGAIVHTVRAVAVWDISLFVLGLIAAGIFLAFGYSLYFAGQWGEADVLMLAAIGFLIPQSLPIFNISPVFSGFLFPFIFLINMFIVGAVYSIIYSIVLAIKNKKVFSFFSKDLRSKGKWICTIFFLSTIAIIAFALSLNIYYRIPIGASLPLFVAIPLILGLLLLYRFANVLEKVLFRKKIPVFKLREGDVLAEEVIAKHFKIKSKLYIGLTPEQIKQIRKVKKSVLIKEGIRYSPVFFLTILITWFFGNILWAILGL